jgi:hypothetical protein
MRYRGSLALMVMGMTTLCSFTSVRAAGVDPAQQAKIDAKVQAIKAWASDPVVLAAVKAHNANLPADQAAITQEKWASLTVLDPLVRGFTKNEAAVFLKSKKSEEIAEAFVSDAAGFKVAFLTKTSNWCHKGKPKHDVPMTGKSWQGQVEVDASTGVQQIQVAVPVMDGGKPIGSLVVGLSIAKLS